MALFWGIEKNGHGIIYQDNIPFYSINQEKSNNYFSVEEYGFLNWQRIFRVEIFPDSFPRIEFSGDKNLNPFFSIDSNLDLGLDKKDFTGFFSSDFVFDIWENSGTFFHNLHLLYNQSVVPQVSDTLLHTGHSRFDTSGILTYTCHDRRPSRKLYSILAQRLTK